MAVFSEGAKIQRKKSPHDRATIVCIGRDNETFFVDNGTTLWCTYAERWDPVPTTILVEIPLDMARRAVTKAFNDKDRLQFQDILKTALENYEE